MTIHYGNFIVDGIIGVGETVSGGYTLPATIGISGDSLMVIDDGMGNKSLQFVTPENISGGSNFGEVIVLTTDRTLLPTDNGKTIICANTVILTIPTGLGSGFGCAIKGTFTYGGTATVTDVREIGAINPWCALVQTGTDTYELVGNKV